MAKKKGTKPTAKPEFAIFGNAGDSEEEIVAAFTKWVEETQARLRREKEEKAAGKHSGQDTFQEASELPGRYQDIYTHHAAQYDLLVSREDYQHQLLPALARIRPLAGLDVVEMGAGTGRLTCLLAPQVAAIRAFDASQPMLDVAAAKLTSLGLHAWTVEVADNRALPLPDGVADLVLAGWSFGHSVGWYEERWREEIGRALAEMRRVLRPGGTAVILETLGTGRETPQPPTPGLAAYYAWLEQEHGFSSTWIRTDYQFDSLTEAADLTGFFFGDDFARQVVEQQWIIVPECTGLWWRSKD